MVEYSSLIDWLVLIGIVIFGICVRYIQPYFLMKEHTRQYTLQKKFAAILKSGSDVDITTFLKNHTFDQNVIMMGLGYAITQEDYGLIETMLKDNLVNLEYTIFDLIISDFVKKISKPIQDKIDLGSENPTPLMFACSIGNLKIVKMLVAAGACIDTESSDQYSPLTSAVVSNNMDVVKYLIECGVDIHGKKGSQTIPLIAAVDSNSREMLDFFIARVSNLNITDDEGATALMFTVLNNNVDMAIALLNAGADLSIRDEEEKDALDDALEFGSKEMITLLKKRVGK